MRNTGPIDSQWGADSNRHASHLADELTDCLGLCPHGLIADFISKGGFARADYNGMPCGFVAYRHRWGFTHVCFTAMEEPLRRLEHASALISLLAADAQVVGSTRLRLWCAADLPANDFWKAIGGRIILRDRGKHRNKRHRNLYIIDLDKFLQGPHYHQVQTCNHAGRFRSASISCLDLSLPVTSALSHAGQHVEESSPLRLELQQTSRQRTANKGSVNASHSRYSTGGIFQPPSAQIGKDWLLPSLSLRPVITCMSASRFALELRAYKQQSDKPEST